MRKLGPDEIVRVGDWVSGRGVMQSDGCYFKDNNTTVGQTAKTVSSDHGDMGDGYRIYRPMDTDERVDRYKSAIKGLTDEIKRLRRELRKPADQRYFGTFLGFFWGKMNKIYGSADKVLQHDMVTVWRDAEQDVKNYYKYHGGKHP